MVDSTDNNRSNRRQLEEKGPKSETAAKPSAGGFGRPPLEPEEKKRSPGPLEAEAYGLMSRRRFLHASSLAAVSVATGAGFSGCTKTNEAEADPHAGNPAPEKEPPKDPPAVARAAPRARATGGEGAEARPEPNARREPNARPEPQPRTESQPRPNKGVIAGRGHIFSVTHATARDSKGRPAIEPVEKMLDRLMLDLTGKRTVKDAWAALFKPKETVALKPNTLAKNACSPSFALVATIIKRLREVGVSEKNILVWDRDHFGRTRLYNDLRKKTPAKVEIHSWWGYEKRRRKLPSGGSVRLSNVLHKADAVISIPVTKEHATTGPTGALKNMAMGTVEQPWNHHANGCNPSIPEIYSLAPIKDKVRLIVTDGFGVVYKGGPGPSGSRRYNVDHESLYVSRDPVTMDRIIWQVIDEVRKDKGKKPLMKRGSKRRGRPMHVIRASKMGLGEVDLAKIKHKHTMMS